MTHDPNQQLHRQIEGAIAAGDVDRARALLRQALQNPTAETYRLAAMVALNEEQREGFQRKAEELGHSRRPLEEPAKESLAEPLKVETTIEAGTGEAASPKTPLPRTRWLPVVLFAVLGAALGIFWSDNYWAKPRMVGPGGGWAWLVVGPLVDPQWAVILCAMLISLGLLIVRALRALRVSRGQYHLEILGLWLVMAGAAAIRWVVIDELEWGDPFLVEWVAEPLLLVALFMVVGLVVLHLARRWASSKRVS